jgi:hypothetical protein
MAHPIDGKTLCVAGTLKWYDRASFKELVEERGGRVASRLSKSTDYLVVGESPGKSADKAETYGVRVLDEDGFKALLRGDVLALSQAAAAPSARPADLHGDPSPAKWGQLLEHVDACAPERAREVVDDLAAWVSTWSTGPDLYPGRPGPVTAHAPRAWARAIPPGDLRVAPFTWVTALAKGQAHPKHELARSIHLEGMDLSRRELNALLAHDHLSNLRALSVDSQAPSKTFWKKLPKAPATRRLERLRLTTVNTAMVDGLADAPAMGRLVDLTLRGVRATSPDLLPRLLGLEVFANVETLRVEVDAFHTVLAALDSPRTLPALDTITLRIPGRISPGLLAHEVCARVPRVDVSWSILLDRNSTTILGDDLAALTDGAIGPRHLDLSRLDIDRKDIKNPLALEPIHRVFAEWKPPTCIARMTLGPWWSEELRAAYDVLSVRAIE